jgi:hypothetical protein
MRKEEDGEIKVGKGGRDLLGLKEATTMHLFNPLMTTNRI